MTFSADFQWTVPPSELRTHLGQFAQLLLEATLDLARYFAAKIEAYAKTHAPWTDRTGNARQGLFARAYRVASSVIIVLSHKMSYGIWLEVAHSGKYAIILKTLERHYGEVLRGYRQLVGQK